MAEDDTRRYLEPSDETGGAFFARNLRGPVVMLNLVRFREMADYSGTPELAPSEPISGEQAYGLYLKHMLPFLEESGGEMVFVGEGGPLLIGPDSERWDLAMVVRQTNASAFLSFAADPEFLAGLGHRQAALEDSRVLPLVEVSLSKIVGGSAGKTQ